MTDLVKRLRCMAESKEAVDFRAGRKAPVYGRKTEPEWQAADEIERLTARVAELEKANRGLQDSNSKMAMGFSDKIKEARAKALREAAEVIRSNKWAASAGLHNDILTLLDKGDWK